MPPRRTDDETPDAESLAFEVSAVRAVTGSIAAGLDEFVVALLAMFEAAQAQAGGTIDDATAVQIGAQVAGRIGRITWTPMRQRLRSVAARALLLGVEQEARRFPRGKKRDAALTAKAKLDELPDPDRALREFLKEAKTLARKGIRTRADIAQVAGRVKAGRAVIQGHVRKTTHEGLNAGTAAVAKKVGERLIWMPERNACLHCLAHAGWVVEPGKKFPPVSFDPKAKGVLSVPYPPLHPNCRCRARSTPLPAGKPSDDKSAADMASALAREARRSVVYQWTDHASGPAAERAASALLAAGANLPTSVITRARRALKKGGYR